MSWPPEENAVGGKQLLVHVDALTKRSNGGAQTRSTSFIECGGRLREEVPKGA